MTTATFINFLWLPRLTDDRQKAIGSERGKLRQSRERGKLQGLIKTCKKREAKRAEKEGCRECRELGGMSCVCRELGQPKGRGRGWGHTQNVSHLWANAWQIDELLGGSRYLARRRSNHDSSSHRLKTTHSRGGNLLIMHSLHSLQRLSTKCNHCSSQQ